MQLFFSEPVFKNSAGLSLIQIFCQKSVRRKRKMEQQSSPICSNAAIYTLHFHFPLSVSKRVIGFCLCPPWAGFLLIVSVYSFPCLASVHPPGTPFIKTAKTFSSATCLCSPWERARIQEPLSREEWVELILCYFSLILDYENWIWIGVWTLLPFFL